jgi:hypothetical protein
MRDGMQQRCFVLALKLAISAPNEWTGPKKDGNKSMKKAIVAASAIGMAAISSHALAADPAPKWNPFSATFDIWTGGLSVDDAEGNVTPDEDDLFIFGADLRARLNLGDMYAIQGDLHTDSTDDTSGIDRHEDGWYAAAHFSHYNETGLFGIMGAVAEGESDNGKATDAWLMGVEGQLYLGQSTLYLQTGYFDAESQVGNEEDAFHDAFFVRGVGRYFVSPQTRLQGEVSGAWGEQNANDKDMDIYGWGFRADHQFTDIVGAFAAYDGAYYENFDFGNGGNEGSYTEHQARLGVSFQLWRPTLLSVDRSGPTLDMPWITHWASSGNNVD